jgi:small conductance mechanosensitive channel
MLLNNILLSIQSVAPEAVSDSTIVAKKEALISSLKTMSIDDLISRLIDGAITLGIRLLIAVVVFYLGQFIIKKLYKISSQILEKRKVGASLTSFLLSLLRIVLLFILVVTIVGILGIETSSFVAIFASAGVAIGLALSGTLQNFAGGVLILLTKP